MRPRPIRRAATAAAGIVLACAAPAVAAERQIGTSAESYRPAAVQIVPGDTVTTAASGFHPLQYEDEPSGGHASGSYSRVFGGEGMFAFYCTNHGGPGGSGMAGRVLVSATNQPPVAILAAFSADTVPAGQTVAFSAAGSGDPEGLPLRFDWDLNGDGLFEVSDSGAAQSRSYLTAGVLTVRVRVTDDPGATADAERALTITAPGAPGGGGGGTGSGPPGSGSPGDAASPGCGRSGPPPADRDRPGAPQRVARRAAGTRPAGDRDLLGARQHRGAAPRRPDHTVTGLRCPLTRPARRARRRRTPGRTASRRPCRTR